MDQTENDTATKKVILESVFVYATLLNKSIRTCICLRYVAGEKAILTGYKKEKRNVLPDPLSSVVGEIINVSQAELRRLDRYERVPRKYQRSKIEIGSKQVWVYTLAKK